MTTAVRRTPAGNLPAELTSFVGRRHELAEARDLLRSSRLVTLTGMGGVGKTRLARRIGVEHRRAFPDGVWQVELADLQEPALLAQAVANALGLRGQAGGWAVATLSEQLAGRTMLLLLDNCEHLLDACAVMTDALLAACPSLHVVATSRQPLGVAGERAFVVQPLSLPAAEDCPPVTALARYDAISLFLERASAEAPGFSVTEANAPAVVQLCQRVEGVPLALELAAIRLRALSVEQVAARLDDRFALLSRGNRLAPARQRSLRALIDWSHELCTAQQQLLWSYLSVFAGGFDLDAAEAICAGTPLEHESVVDLVADLLDMSLLRRDDVDGAVRYRMVEIVRAYGLERLRAAGEEQAVRTRHRRWFAELAHQAHAQWFGGDQLAWYLRVRQESHNIRLAMDLSGADPAEVDLVVDTQVALADCNVALGTVAEAAHWLDRSLGRCAEGPTRARGLRVAAYVAALQGDTAASLALLEECEALATRLGMPEELAWCTTVAALLALNRGDLRVSRGLYERGHEGFVGAGDRYGEVFTVGCSAVLAALLGDGEGAAASYASFKALADPAERWMRAYVRWAMGMERWQADDVAGAEALALEAVALREPLRDHLGIALCLEVLAWVAARKGRPDVAARLLGRALRSFELGGSSVERAGFVSSFHESCLLDLGRLIGQQEVAAELERGRQAEVAEVVALLQDERHAPPKAVRQGRRDAASPLTRRERDIAQLVAEGLSNKEIAASLVIAQRTAEGHVEHILTKLGFRSRSQVAAWVAEQRAVPPEEAAAGPD